MDWLYFEFFYRRIPKFSDRFLEAYSADQDQIYFLSLMQF